MKNIFIITGFLLLFLLTNISAFAQTDSSGFIMTKEQMLNTVTTEKPNTSENTQYISNILISSPSFENKTYSQGEIVKTMISIENKDMVDYSDVTISGYISVYTEDETMREYGYQANLAQVFIPKQTTKNVNFDFEMPNSISFEEGDVLRFEIHVIQKTGQVLGNSSSLITLGNFESGIDVVGASIEANDKEYTLQEGPVVSSDATIQQVVSFSNNTESEVILYPVLKVYDLQPSRPLIDTVEYDSINISASAESETFKFDLPKSYKPGVYAGEISFFDEQGINKTQFISNRWIVDGDMATIPSVTIDKSTGKRGEVVLVDVAYTGAPINPDTGEARETGKGVIIVNLYNEKNKLIGTQEKEVNLSTTRDNTFFDITLESNARSIAAEVIVMKQGVELARYTTELTDPEMNPIENSNVTTIISIISLLIILIAALFVSRRINSKKISLMGIALLLFLGTVSISEAGQVACYDGSFCASADLMKNSFLPGESIEEFLSVGVNAVVCYNTPSNKQVEWLLWDNSLSFTDAGYFKYSVAAIDYHVVGLRQFGFFSPKTSTSKSANIMKAPEKPGNYNITLWVYEQGYYSGSGVTNKGPIRFDLQFNVACPVGQRNIDGQCESESCDASHTEGEEICINGKINEYYCNVASNSWKTRRTDILCDACDASPSSVTVGNSVTFTTPYEDDALYKWYTAGYNNRNKDEIEGETDNTFTLRYNSLVNDQKILVGVTKGSGTEKLIQCGTVSVSCGPKPTSGETACTGSQQKVYRCTDSGWQLRTETCGGTQVDTTQSEPTVNKFVFSPNIANSVSNTCPLEIDIQNTTGCTLTNRSGTKVDLLPNSGAFNLIHTGNYSVGTYELKCGKLVVQSISSFGGEVVVGTKSCYSNAEISEN